MGILLNVPFYLQPDCWNCFIFEFPNWSICLITVYYCDYIIHYNWISYRILYLHVDFNHKSWKMIMTKVVWLWGSMIRFLKVCGVSSGCCVEIPALLMCVKLGRLEVVIRCGWGVKDILDTLHAFTCIMYGLCKLTYVDDHFSVSVFVAYWSSRWPVPRPKPRPKRRASHLHGLHQSPARSRGSRTSRRSGVFLNQNCVAMVGNQKSLLLISVISGKCLKTLDFCSGLFHRETSKTGDQSERQVTTGPTPCWGLLGVGCDHSRLFINMLNSQNENGNRC